MRKNLLRISIPTLTLLVLPASLALSQQQGKSASERSYQEARKVLDAGIAAMGGLEALRAVKNVSRKASGTIYNQGQSLEPDAPYTTRPLEVSTVTDFSGKRNRSEVASAFQGGIAIRNRQMLKGDTGMGVNLVTSVATPMTPAAVTGAKNAMRRDPAALLLTALSRAETLRSLGPGVVTFADTDGTQIALYFDPPTKLLAKYETLADNPVLGDTLTEVALSDYRDVGGVKLPFRLVVRTGGEVTQELKYSEIQANSSLSDTLFEDPQGLERGSPVSGPTTVTTSKLADDVYFAEGSSHHSLFVVFKDHILVVEAPQSDERSQAVIAKIKETAPGKPIKYLVPTHYHYDHSGGIRGYIAEGATIVSTPGNKAFIEKLAVTPHGIKPDTLSLNARKPAIETFTKKKVFSDGTRTVEIHDVGPNPHVEEAVVAYLPKEKILFVSDLFTIPAQGPVPEAGPAVREFAAKVKSLGLEVERIAPGHGRVGSMEDLKKALGERAAAK